MRLNQVFIHTSLEVLCNPQLPSLRDEGIPCWLWDSTGMGVSSQNVSSGGAGVGSVTEGLYLPKMPPTPRKLLSDPLELSAQEKPYRKVCVQSQPDEINEGKVPKVIMPGDCMMLFYIVSISLPMLLYMQCTVVTKCSLNKRFFVFSR